MGSSGESRSPEERARARAAYLAGLLWHAGTFLIINAFFWILDLRGPGGVTWAYWVTIFWGLALAFHALAWFIDGRDLEERKTRQYLEPGERSPTDLPR